MNKFEFKNLTPFKWFVLENFPFIEADFDALTEWQLFCKLGKEINKIIDSQNVVGTQMENVTNAFIDLQNDYIEKFNNLKEYVNNYFNNLDVQDEINNKLNEMVEDGTLPEIIASYLNSKALFGYDTVASMKQATNLINGSYAKTLGYYAVNDGGGATYKITNKEDSNSIQEQLDSGLYATLILFNKTLNIKQLGAKGDGTTDDTNAIINAINYFHVGTDEDNQNYATILLRNYPDAGGTIYFPKGVYCISSTIKIPCYVDVDFGYSTIKAISGGTFTSDYMFSVNSYSLNSWTYAYVGRKGFIKNATIDGNDITNIKGFYIFDPHKIENMTFSKLYTSLKYGSGATIYIDGVYVNRIDIINAQGNDYQIQKSSQGENLYLTNITFETSLVNGIRITNGHSGLIENLINGCIYLYNAEDIIISKWHCERGYIESYSTTNLTIRDSTIYVRNNSTPITIGSGDMLNNLRSAFLENVKFIYYLFIEEFNYDTKDIDISNFVGNIFIKGCYREQWTTSIHAIAQTGIQLFDGTNYLLNPFDECEIINKKILPNNSTIRTDEYIFNNPAPDNYVKWNLETRTYYYKLINFADVDKLVGRASDEKTATVTDVNKGLRIPLGPNLGHGNIVRLYRGTETGVYTHYVDIPNPKNMNLYDNGYSISGYKWKTNNGNVPSVISMRNIERIDIHNGNLVRCKATTTPTYGTWVQGDIIERVNPSANGNLGWVCTETGTPGTWKEFGTIQS